MPKLHANSLPTSSDYERDDTAGLAAPATVESALDLPDMPPIKTKSWKKTARSSTKTPEAAVSKKRAKTKFQSVTVTFSVKVEAEEPVPVFFSQLPLGAMFRFCTGKLVRDAHPFGIKVGKTSYLYPGHDKVLNRKERVTKAEKVIELPATLHVQDRIAVAAFNDPTVVPDTKESS